MDSKKKFKIVSIILVFLFCACSGKNDITQLKIKNVLVPEKVVNISDGCYSEVLINDSLLILVSRCDTNLFHVYNKNTLDFITSFGKKGRSPQEFFEPIFYRNITTSVTSTSVLDFYDQNLAQNKRINFGNIAKGVNPYECIESSILEHELFETYDLSYLGKNKVVGRKIGECPGLFFIDDLESKDRQWIDFIPNKGVDDLYKTNVYHGSLWSNTKNIMYASRNFDEVLFFNSNGILLKEHHFSKLKKPVLSKTDPIVSTESMLYFLRAYGTPNYCYALRVGRTGTDFYENFHAPTNILVFDWEGNLKNVYQHKYYPTSFCVDEETNTMYCLIRSYVTPDVRLEKIPL